MSAGQIFEVLTEFRFDTANAIAQSKVVQTNIKGISDAADDALSSLQRMSFGMAAALGLGAGGILGTLKKAVDISDNFHASVLDFTSVITANMTYLNGSVTTFNDRLAASKKIMEDISDQSAKLGVDKNDVLSVVKAIVPILAPHGAAGNNFSNAIEVGKAAAVAGPAIGLNSAAFAEQYKSLLSGSGTQNQLFTALLSTKSMKGQKFDDFNSGDFKAKVAMVSQGLKELSGDLGDLEERAGLVSTQMKAFKDAIESILKPLGDMLRPIVVDIFKKVNTYLHNEGMQTAKIFTQLLKSFISSPREMLLNVMQAKSLHADLNRSVEGVKFVGAVTGVTSVLSFLTGAAWLANPAIGAVAAGLFVMKRILEEFDTPLTKALAKITLIVAGIGVISAVLAKFGLLLSALNFIFVEVLVPLSFFMFVFQAISRAIAMAKLDDAETFARLLPQFMEIFTRLKMAFMNMILPITMAIDGIAKLLEPLFMWSFWMEMSIPMLTMLADVFDTVGTAIVALMAALNGLVAGVFQAVLDMKEGNFGSIKDDFGKAVFEGFSDFMDKHLQKMDQGGNVSNHVTNIGKVEIRNDFKENMEPDRIAFTLKEQLLKAAQNPTQARNNTFQGGTIKR